MSGKYIHVLWCTHMMRNRPDLAEELNRANNNAIIRENAEQIFKTAPDWMKEDAKRLSEKVSEWAVKRQMWRYREESR